MKASPVAVGHHEPPSTLTLAFVDLKIKCFELVVRFDTVYGQPHLRTEDNLLSKNVSKMLRFPVAAKSPKSWGYLLGDSFRRKTALPLTLPNFVSVCVSDYRYASLEV